VAKLETLSREVDACQQRLAKIPVLLKRFRQSVLAAACSGGLTVDWRKTATTPGTALRLRGHPKAEKKYSISDEASLPKLPDSWTHVPIGNIAEFQQGMQIAKNTRLKEPGLNRLPILRIGNYETGFKEDVDYVKLDADLLIAESADVILAWTGETRGKILTGYRGVFHNNTFRINYERKLLVREYLIAWLGTDFVQSFIRNSSGRSAQPDLTHKAFGPCPVALPPLLEQQEIVRRVEGWFALADQIEARFEKARAHVAKLTPSLLARAFRGELVPQDPDDEPASVLLDRLRLKNQEGGQD
jgi:type I restriction enzyme S subunit